jgi:hypothetical protein
MLYINGINLLDLDDAGEAEEDSLERWGRNHGDAQLYWAFFHACAGLRK